ncbi:hypothetical protein CTAYLR_003420 [Chrysophaeum taylorii]|uniref:ATP-dependent protease subunit HslV n=1 Tax=Chrysophaeum taylorii TaxID=2483200 RepID=A0AAD7U7N4_9STRA|nr:hypothetical protein CTAYLR_003420 [Chrysophaeum taylorii]
MHGTTILCVRKEGRVALIGDGMVSMGSQIVKGNAKKVRRLGDGVLVGFAGSTADAFTLLERLERKLEEHPGQLTRACVDLAKAWRTDKYLRRLEAILLVADSEVTFELTGNGDVLEPTDGIMGIGSGGAFALAAARALKDVDGLNALEIAKRAMDVAAGMCVYTNHNFIIEELPQDPKDAQASAKPDARPPDDDATPSVAAPPPTTAPPQKAE